RRCAGGWTPSSTMPTWASSGRSCGPRRSSTSARCAGVMPRSTEQLLARLLGALERELPRAVELRRRLHAQPELAHAEEQTAAAVAEQLPVPATAAAGTGRVARVGPDGE